MLWLLLIVHVSIVAGFTAKHTIWIPAGRRVMIPCNLKSLESAVTTDLWIHRNRDLNVQFAPNSAIGWYNKQGELIHVGEFLIIQLPGFEASELALTQFLPHRKTPDQETINLAPKYRDWVDGTHKLLQHKQLDAVTCSELQTSTVTGTQDPWKQYERKTHIRKQIFFNFRVYVQPIIVWQYAAPPEIEFENRTVLLDPIKKWCRRRRPTTHYKGHFCASIYEQRRPFLSLPRDTDDIPPIQSDAPSFIETGIRIDLTVSALNLLADPTGDQLSYIHARTKQELDLFILNNLKEQFQKDRIEEPMTVATRIRAICPPGSQTYMPTPALTSLQLNDTVQSLQKSSAAALIPFVLICHPCEPGQSPRMPYAYDQCHECPRGYYLGNTGWPSSAGCLPCPKGFTTDAVGAKTIKDCKLNAGAITRWALSYLFEKWFELEDTIAGEVTSDVETRALGQHKESPWAWLGKLKLSLWLWGSLYLLVTFWLSALAIYRLHLYFKLQSILKRQYKLLLKAALIGQINLVSHIKQRAKATELNSPIPEPESVSTTQVAQ